MHHQLESAISTENYIQHGNSVPQGYTLQQDTLNKVH